MFDEIKKNDRLTDAQKYTYPKLYELCFSNVNIIDLLINCVKCYL